MNQSLWISLAMIVAGTLALAGLIVWLVARPRAERAIVVHPPRPAQCFDRMSFRFDLKKWLADAFEIDNLVRKWSGKIGWPSRRSKKDG